MKELTIKIKYDFDTVLRWIIIIAVLVFEYFVVMH